MVVNQTKVRWFYLCRYEHNIGCLNLNGDCYYRDFPSSFLCFETRESTEWKGKQNCRIFQNSKRKNSIVPWLSSRERYKRCCTELFQTERVRAIKSISSWRRAHFKTIVNRSHRKHPSWVWLNGGAIIFGRYYCEKSNLVWARGTNKFAKWNLSSFLVRAHKVCWGTWKASYYRKSLCIFYLTGACEEGTNWKVENSDN